MGIATLPSFIAGVRVEPDASSPRIRSIDGEQELPVAETTPVQLRRALRYADEGQALLLDSSLAQRIEAARLVIREYARREGDACWSLAKFRGLVARDTRWMCEVNVRWAEQFEVLVEAAFGSMARRIASGESAQGVLSWRSKGKACLFSSSTMDGPAAVVALAHAMISGTHLILRPSFRDAATHFAFEILEAHGLSHYAQLVRWRGNAPDAPLLNRQLLGNVAQGIVFSANETYRELLDGVATPGSADWDALHARTTRYGTGLPLAIVTAQADLDRAARDIVEGARLGGGRFCLSAGPVLVDRSCQRELLERIVRQASELRRGPPLDEQSELSSHETENAEGMRAALASFGGSVAHGAIRPTDMDVVVLADVPMTSSALHRELPGPVLSLIPVDGLAEAAQAAGTALRRNHRQAWTAVVVFGNERDFIEVQRSVTSFRYLAGGVVSRVRLLLPHQGSYFAVDLMRRVSIE
jgi:acyl-CoA reductase-like NAD-dependent aldehyde dehydrogenase